MPDLLQLHYGSFFSSKLTFNLQQLTVIKAPFCVRHLFRISPFCPAAPLTRLSRQFSQFKTHCEFVA